MSMRVIAVRRWPHNEYEGELTVMLGDHEVVARVVTSEDEWQALREGVQVEGEVTFLRYGAWELVPPAFSLDLTEAARVTLVGTIDTVDDENVTVRELPGVTVDLDTSDARLSELAVGLGLSVEGRFELDVEAIVG